MNQNQQWITVKAYNQQIQIRYSEPTWYVGQYLAYCTSPGWSMMIMEQVVESGLAGETEVLGKNLPQCHFVHHKSHMIGPGI
jgi:hypothetical protein